MNSVTQNTAISNEVVAVKFYDDTLITLEKDGEHYVAVRPIVENMGLEWSTQKQKLDRNPKFGCVHMNTPTNGGTQKMLCIPVRKLNGWLFSINPEKVRSDIRHIVEQYQEECFTVLHDYWHNGMAVNENHYHNTFNHITVMPPLCGKEFLVRIQDDGTWAMRELGGDEYVLNMKQMDAGHLPYGLKQLHSIHKLSLVNALSQSLTQDYLQDVRNAKNLAGFLD